MARPSWLGFGLSRQSPVPTHVDGDGAAVSRTRRDQELDAIEKNTLSDAIVGYLENDEQGAQAIMVAAPAIRAGLLSAWDAGRRSVLADLKNKGMKFNG